MRVWSREVLFKSLVGEKKKVLAICSSDIRKLERNTTEHLKVSSGFDWARQIEFSIFILSPLCPFLCFSHILRNPIFKTWKKANKTLRHSPYLYKSPLLLFHFVMSISWVCIRAKLPPSNPTSKNLRVTEISKFFVVHVDSKIKFKSRLWILALHQWKNPL